MQLEEIGHFSQIGHEKSQFKMNDHWNEASNVHQNEQIKQIKPQAIISMSMSCTILQTVSFMLQTC